MTLPTIPHHFQAATIEQRALDGYLNATAMCKAAGKKFYDYSRLGTTQAFLAALSLEAGIPASEQIQVLKGGDTSKQGTWVHPKVAIHLAQWLSPEFAVQVTNWVFDWLNGKTVNVKEHTRRPPQKDVAPVTKARGHLSLNVYQGDSGTECEVYAKVPVKVALRMAEAYYG